MQSRGRLRPHLAHAVSAAIGMATASTPVKALKLQEFVGYWAGTGVVTMTNGSTEQLKCVATYKSAQQDLRQSLRCASTGYLISAAVELKVSGDAITGTWEEKTYSANGLITGQMTEAGFALSIKGATFTADMNLSHSVCKQVIDIIPIGVDVSKITIGLGKC